MNVKEEQVEIENDSTSKIGKFDTADELLAAYNALESEFTKRCQLIKQLQAELNASNAQAKSAPVTISDDGAASGDKAEGQIEIAENDFDSAERNATSSESVSDDFISHAVMLADVLSEIPEIMDACVARYKRKLIDCKCGGGAPAGMAVIVPAKRPRSLAEAKILAEQLLKNRT